MSDVPVLSETEMVAKIERFGSDKPPLRCRTIAGSDRCDLEQGHDGQHQTLWAGINMRWSDNDPWSHQIPEAVAS